MGSVLRLGSGGGADSPALAGPGIYQPPGYQPDDPR